MVTKGALCLVLMTSGHASMTVDKVGGVSRSRGYTGCGVLVWTFIVTGLLRCSKCGHTTPERIYLVHAIEVSHEVCKYLFIRVSTKISISPDLTINVFSLYDNMSIKI